MSSSPVAMPPETPIESPAQPEFDTSERLFELPDVSGEQQTPGFEVHLDNFEGPFDLLLGLIAKHKLDITEIALAQVTDEFVAHMSAGEWDLDQASEFLVVAATLLDLKAARLLPAGTVEDGEDLELLEARDLLFARLLQYRAFKQVASVFAERLLAESSRYPRAVPLEGHFASLLPELVWSVGPEAFAGIAQAVFAPKTHDPGLDLSHLHAPPVSVRDEALVLVHRLRRHKTMTFRTMVADAAGTLVVVVRFLALLELFREGAVAFEQLTPLGELTVRWTGSLDGDIDVRDEYHADVEPEPPIGEDRTNGDSIASDPSTNGLDAGGAGEAATAEWEQDD